MGEREQPKLLRERDREIERDDWVDEQRSTKQRDGCTATAHTSTACTEPKRVVSIESVGEVPRRGVVSGRTIGSWIDPVRSWPYGNHEYSSRAIQVPHRLLPRRAYSWFVQNPRSSSGSIPVKL